MDQELLEEIQNIKEFKTYRVWRIGLKGSGSWISKRYTRKRDVLNSYEYYVGKKCCILAEVSSDGETKYEWI